MNHDFKPDADNRRCLICGRLYHHEPTNAGHSGWGNAEWIVFALAIGVLTLLGLARIYLALG